MVFVVLLIGLGLGVAMVLKFGGHSKLAKGLGFALIGLTLAFAFLVVFGMLFND